MSLIQHSEKKGLLNSFIETFFGIVYGKYYSFIVHIDALNNQVE